MVALRRWASIFADSSRVHRIALPEIHSPLRNSSGADAIRLCPGLSLLERSMISAILFPNGQETDKCDPACFKAPQFLVYENVPVEVYMFDHGTGAPGYGGKRVVGYVDLELGVFGEKLVETL